MTDLDTLIDDDLATGAWYHDTRHAWPTKAHDWLPELDAIDARLVATAAGVPVDVPALRGGHWSQAERHQAVAAIAAKVDVEIGRALLAAFTADAITR
jgi:hypothetical protein